MNFGSELSESRAGKVNAIGGKSNIYVPNTKMVNEVCPSPQSTPFCVAVDANPILEFLYRPASFSRLVPSPTRYTAQSVISVGLVWTPIKLFGRCFLNLHLFVTPFPLTCCSLNPYREYTVIGVSIVGADGVHNLPFTAPLKLRSFFCVSLFHHGMSITRERKSSWLWLPSPRPSEA